MTTIGMEHGDGEDHEDDYWGIPEEFMRKCSPGQGLKDDECYSCPPGSYNFEGSLVDVCFPCPVGHFSSESGSRECKTCSEAMRKPSTTKDSGGATSMDSCVDYDDVIGTFSQAELDLSIQVVGKDFCTGIDDMLYGVSHVIPFDGHFAKCKVMNDENGETVTEMHFKISPPGKLAWELYEMFSFVHSHVDVLNGYIQLGSHFAELLMNLVNALSSEEGGFGWLGFTMNPDVLEIENIKIQKFEPSFRGICSYAADEDDVFCDKDGNKDESFSPDFVAFFTSPTASCSDNARITRIRNRIEYGDEIFQCQFTNACEVMFLGCDESEENGIRSTNVIVRVMGKGDLSDESLQPDAFKVDFGDDAAQFDPIKSNDPIRGCFQRDASGPKGLQVPDMSTGVSLEEPTCEKCDEGSFLDRHTGQCHPCPYGSWGEDGLHCKSCGWHYETPFTGMSSQDQCIEIDNWWKVDDWRDQLRRSTGRNEFKLAVTPTLNMCDAVNAKKELDEKCGGMFPSNGQLDWPEDGINLGEWNIERIVCSASTQVTPAYTQACGEDWDKSWDEIFDRLMEGRWESLLDAACYVGKPVKELEGKDTSNDCANLDIDIVEMSMPAEFQGAMDMMTASVVAPLFSQMENLVTMDFASFGDAMMAMMKNMGMDDVNALLGWQIGNDLRDVVMSMDRGFSVRKFQFSAQWNSDDFFCENGNARRDCRDVNECDYTTCRVFERDEDKDIKCKIDECNNCAFDFYYQEAGAVEGTFNDVPYECASCKDEFASEIENGRLRKVHKNNVEASYMCNENYVPEDCYSGAKCDIEGDPNSETGRISYPKCVPDQCQFPDSVDNGFFYGDWRSEAERPGQDMYDTDYYECPYVNYYCNDGYRPRDYNSRIECNVKDDFQINPMPFCEEDRDDNEDGHEGCHFPDLIPRGYKMDTYQSESMDNGDQVAMYMCYPPFVMTPNRDMMFGHMENSGVDVGQAYKDLYNVAFCNEESTGGKTYFPECKEPEEARHCGIPNYIEHGYAAEFIFMKDLMMSDEDKDGENMSDMDENGKNRIKMDDWMKEKMEEEDWRMMDDMMPIAAKYECYEGHMMRRTMPMEGNMGWCRKDGSFEVPACVSREDYWEVKLKLDNGGNRKMVNKNGDVFAGVVLSMTVDSDGDPMTDWQFGCRDGSNDYAAGAICRTLGFMHGTHIQVPKKMMKSLDGEFGWTRFSCDYDDTLTYSNHCRGMLYDDAMSEMGMKAKCFDFDTIAVKCFQNAEFNVDVNVRYSNKKVMCNPMASKKGYKIDLAPMVNNMMEAKFMLDDEEIEVEDLSFKKRQGFVAKYDLRRVDFSCLTCEIYMDGSFIASGESCKDDA